MGTDNLGVHVSQVFLPLRGPAVSSQSRESPLRHRECRSAGPDQEHAPSGSSPCQAQIECESADIQRPSNSESYFCNPNIRNQGVELTRSDGEDDGNNSELAQIERVIDIRPPGLTKSCSVSARWIHPLFLLGSGTVSGTATSERIDVIYSPSSVTFDKVGCWWRLVHVNSNTLFLSI